MNTTVVVATYNRELALKRLLGQLTRQTVRRDDLEVVVVDDGSSPPAAPAIRPFEADLRVKAVRQANSGVAVARQRGAEIATGDILIFLDDDMLIKEDFVEQHLAAHRGHGNRVVLGRLLPSGEIAEMPLFERFHAEMLERMSRRCEEAGTFAGHELYTGNMSLPRELFFRAGGFDPAFFIEDTELGVRLDQQKAQFVFCSAAASVHASDHTSLESWLRRSVVEGGDWVRLSHKHPHVASASPFSMIDHVSPLLLPLLAASMALPDAAPPLSRALYRGALALDALGLHRAALAATTAVYGSRYCEGVRRATGGLGDVIAAYRAHRKGGHA